MIVLSGPGAERVLAKVFRPLRTHTDNDEGVLRVGRLVEGEAIIDEAVVTRRGAAFEINIHGGSAAAKAVLELLVRCGAVVGAKRTAVESFPAAHPRWENPAIGREMLQVLPRARSELTVAAIAAQWSAGVSELASREATGGQLREAARGLAGMRRLLEPPEVVLAGEPNVGKSTLANALVGREVSIVHDVPGTTRDWVREPAIVDGVPVWVTDTAGLWKAPHQIDAEAVRRARRCIEEADLVVLLHVGRPCEVPDCLSDVKVLRVAAKCDVATPNDEADMAVSALTGEGLAELRKAIVDRIGLGGFHPSVPAAFTQRQADLLNAAASALGAGEAGRAERLLADLLRGPSGSRHLDSYAR